MSLAASMTAVGPTCSSPWRHPLKNTCPQYIHMHKKTTKAASAHEVQAWSVDRVIPVFLCICRNIVYLDTEQQYLVTAAGYARQCITSSRHSSPGKPNPNCHINIVPRIDSSKRVSRLSICLRDTTTTIWYASRCCCVHTERGGVSIVM